MAKKRFLEQLTKGNTPQAAAASISQEKPKISPAPETKTPTGKRTGKAKPAEAPEKPAQTMDKKGKGRDVGSGERDLISKGFSCASWTLDLLNELTFERRTLNLRKTIHQLLEEAARDKTIQNALLHGDWKHVPTGSVRRTYLLPPDDALYLEQLQYLLRERSASRVMQILIHYFAEQYGLTQQEE